MNTQAIERSADAIIARLPIEEQVQVTELRRRRRESQGEFVRHAIWKAAQAYELTADDYERLADVARQLKPVPEVKFTPQRDGRVYLEVNGALAEEIHTAAQKRGITPAAALREAIAEFEASLARR